MANKYIIHGATYNGDGTSSAEATSNGGAGAWNTITYFEGVTPAYGALVAGDTVYIRSKDAAGAGITRNPGAAITLGSSAATGSAPVTWVLDGANVWPSVDGVLTYTRSVTTYGVSFSQYNIVSADNPARFVIESTATSTVSDGQLANLGVGATLRNARLDFSSHTGAGRFSVAYMSNGAVLDSPVIKAGAMASSLFPASGLFSMTSRRGSIFIVNPDIEMTVGAVNAGLMCITSTYGNILNIIGGRLYGIGTEVTGARLLTHDGVTGALVGGVRMVGFQFPRNMEVIGNGGFATGVNNCVLVSIFGCDNGAGGYTESTWGWATSRTDNYPPTLSARLPDSNSTAWAWRVYPKGASAANPMQLSASKLFSEASASKEITQEILIADSFSLNKSTLWIDVEYTDATTGLPKHVSTRDFGGGDLTPSTATWSTTTWGMINSVKRKLTLTTPTSIKQDSLVTVTLWGIGASSTVNDILFVDPDFGVN